MTRSSVVHRPTARHSCRIGWELRTSATGSYYASIGDYDPPGTIRECECGRTWVAYRPDPMSGVMVARWRPEGRFERWRRERKVRRG